MGQQNIEGLDIYFKNVGQGDTIFIHWDQDRKFGMIDCNLVDGKIEETIKHMKKFGISRLDFVVMSHPHSDHFSGFPKFFEYCQQHNIIIDRFFHTAVFDPKRLKVLLNRKIDINELYDQFTSVVNRVDHKNTLWSLFELLNQQHKMRPDGFIKAVYTISNDYYFEFNDTLRMKFLAPYDYDEFDEYINGTYELEDDEKLKFTQKYENNPRANYLSTLLQIDSRSDNWQILLCSDVTKYTFKRIFRNDAEFSGFRRKKLLAAQIPHHGSYKNHYPDFWNNLEGVNNAHFVISVGHGYGHPAMEVVDYFRSWSENVHSTNYVGGYKISHEKNPPRDGFAVMDFTFNLPGVTDNSDKNIRLNANGPKCCEKRMRIEVVDGLPVCRIFDGDEE